MGEHDPLWVAGAPGRILNERRRLACGRLRREHRIGGEKVADRLDPLQALCEAVEQPPEGADLWARDERRGSGIAQDAGLPAQVILDQAAAKRRIDRHRHATRHEHAEEGLEEARFRRQHDGDAITGLVPTCEKAAGDASRRRVESGVGDDLLGLLAAPENNVRPLSTQADMIVERLEKGLGLDGLGDRRQRGWRCSGKISRCDTERAGRLYGLEKVSRGRGIAEDLIRQLDLEGAVEPQHELRAGQAVETEIAVEVAVEPNHDRALEMRVQLDGEIAHDGEQLIGKPALARGPER